MTMIQLANVTLSSAASSITFGSIPTSVNGVALRDLYLVAWLKTSGQTDVVLSLNADTSNTYVSVSMAGTGSTTGSSIITRTGYFIAYNGSTSETSFTTATILDFVASDKHKTSLTRWNNTNDSVQALAGRWPSTSVVTSLAVRGTGSNLASGTTLALYGVAG
jgi:hypothetical protein